MIPCLVDAESGWQMLMAGPATRALRSWVPRGVSAWMYTSLEVCSHMFAELECKRKAVVAILSRIFMEFAVWAAAHSTDGRVPLKIGGSRFDRQFSHRLRHLSAAFSAFFFLVTKPGFFRLTVHISK